MTSRSNKAHSPKVLIVGAGPTGLTAAVELARHGIIPDLIEKRSTASNLSRAVGILPASMDLLEPSGVAAAIRQEAVAIEEVIFHQASNEFARVPLIEKDQLANPSLMALAQDRTETHLLQAFERYGGRVRYGESLTELEQDEHGVTVQIEHFQAQGNPQPLKSQYDYVIGADGVRSAVRESLGVTFAGFEIEGLWSIADVDCEDCTDITAFKIYLLSQGRVVVVVPLESARFRVISNTDDALAALPILMNISNIRRAGAFPISVRQVEKYSVGRVFLAGDAAHCHSPAGGRGMNLGIADAADLARRIAFDASEGGLAGYHDARHAIGASTIAFSERGRKVVTSKNKLTQLLLRNTLRLITRFPFIRRRIAINFLQMDS